MNHLYLIGITGPAGSGKDTAAGGAINVFGYQRICFGDQVKAMLAKGLNLDIEAFYDTERKEQPISWLGKSPRQLMQTLGTDWGRRMVSPDIWVHLFANLVALAPAGARIVVPDVRFESEANWIREHGGEIWHLASTHRAAVPAHESEAGICFRPELGDKPLINNASIFALQSAAASLAAEYESNRFRERRAA